MGIQIVEIVCIVMLVQGQVQQLIKSTLYIVKDSPKKQNIDLMIGVENGKRRNKMVKKRKKTYKQSVTFVTKVTIKQQTDHYGRPCRTIIVKRDSELDFELQLSGFEKNIPVIIK